MKLMHPLKSYRSETFDAADATDNDDAGVMISMCHPCFAGDTKSNSENIIQTIHMYHTIKAYRGLDIQL